MASRCSRRTVRNSKSPCSSVEVHYNRMAAAEQLKMAQPWDGFPVFAPDGTQLEESLLIRGSPLQPHGCRGTIEDGAALGWLPGVRAGRYATRRVPAHPWKSITTAWLPRNN